MSTHGLTKKNLKLNMADTCDTWLFVLKYTQKNFFFKKKTKLTWGSVGLSYPEK